MRRISILLAMALLAVTSSSCEKWFHREDTTDYENVMILCSAGHNNLSTKLSEDIQDMSQSYIPKKNEKRALLVVSHFPATTGVYTTPTSPSVVQLYRDKKNRVVADTLARLSAGSSLAEKAGMRGAMDFIHDHFPSKVYGMVFSSHATGWVPQGFYNASQVQWLASPRSIGHEDAGQNTAYELDLRDFADCFPFHLNYMVFDACLMGGVEVAYELKDLCDQIAFCPTETMTEGFNYETLTAHLLEGAEPDVEKVCQDFFRMYENHSQHPFATITLVDCRKLSSLAIVCKGLFSQYREEIRSVSPYKVQPYFRADHHWFYDLEDILVQSGISESELSALRSALSECIVYKAATPKFISIPINVYSGLSMYLPANGTTALDAYYRTLAWNQATGLVE